MPATSIPRICTCRHPSQRSTECPLTTLSGRPAQDFGADSGRSAFARLVPKPDGLLTAESCQAATRLQSGPDAFLVGGVRSLAFCVPTARELKPVFTHDLSSARLRTGTCTCIQSLH